MDCTIRVINDQWKGSIIFTYKLKLLLVSIFVILVNDLVDRSIGWRVRVSCSCVILALCFRLVCGICFSIWRIYGFADTCTKRKQNLLLKNSFASVSMGDEKPFDFLRILFGKYKIFLGVIPSEEILSVLVFHCNKIWFR